MKYALKHGFQFSPDDLVVVHEDIAALTETGHAAGLPPRQRVLDLKAKPAEPVKPPKPWESAHPRVTAPFNLRLSQALHAKLKYLTSIVPATSMNTIAIAAIEREVARLLAEYDKT